MKGVCGFNGGGASEGPAVVAAVKEEEEEEDGDEREEEEEDEELELGLSLGGKRVNSCGNRAAPWGEYCRILTAKDFPSLGSRPLPRPSTSSVSSSSAAVGGGGGGAGTKRAADSVASDVGGGSASPHSQVVVGWPPIRAFRMNTLVNQSRDNFSDSETTAHKKNHHDNSSNSEVICSNDQENKGVHVGCSRFVKVNMDGDAIGRKVDLNAHLCYETLALALEIMFQKPTMTIGGSTHGAKVSKLLDGSSEFALTYEDKDGDWMLVGDVPWGMFLDTVKRLRIMRTSDANGLAPRFRSPSDKSTGLVRSLHA